MCRRIAPTLLIVCSCALLLLSCDNDVRHKRNLVCLIDYSASMNDEIIQGYMHVMEDNVLANIGEHDRLVVLPVDGASKTRASKIYYLDMQEHDFARAGDGFAHARDSVVARIRQYMHTVSLEIMAEIRRQRVARKQFANYSDLFSALHQAGSYVRHDTGSPSQTYTSSFLRSNTTFVAENVVIIFSDMKHESAEFTFATGHGCPPDRVEPILDALQKRNGIPDLSGCTVFVYGRTGKSNEEVENIQHFWEEYFREAHAFLAAYDYETDNVISAFMMMPH